MSYEKIGKVLNTIYDDTKRGILTWDESIMNDAYELSFVQYSVRIFKEAGENARLTYHLQIINAEGDVIEDVTNRDMDSEVSNSIVKMREIHDIARRQVLGVEQALDDILKELTEISF